MFTYSKTEIANFAKESGFIRDTLEKVLRLLDVLDFINTAPFLRERLALKGGTALNLTIFELPRLSVDIDLDFTENLSSADLIPAREEINRMISVYMSTQRYQRHPRTKSVHSLDTLIFSYLNHGKTQDNLKIEINYSLRSHLFPPIYSSVISLLNYHSKILTLAPLEIFAAKINALLSRAAPRDLYDIHNMIQFESIAENQQNELRRCVVFYTAISQDSFELEYKLDKIRMITPQKIKTDLFPVIHKSDRFDLERAKREVSDYLEKLLRLTPEEREFLSAFQLNRYCPELVFPDQETLTRVKRHPMALWKTKTPPDFSLD